MDYMNDEQEMLFIIYKNIKDHSIKMPLIKAIHDKKWNVARIISDGITDKFPYHQEYKRLDSLILNKFYE